MAFQSVPACPGRKLVGSPATIAAITKTPPDGKVGGGGWVMVTPEMLEVRLTGELAFLL
jgi:hypothetical protein